MQHLSMCAWHVYDVQQLAKHSEQVDARYPSSFAYMAESTGMQMAYHNTD